MARYQNFLNIDKLETGKRYYTSVIPIDPLEDQVQYTYKARTGDRWDTIAHTYLGSAALWYVIANANSSLNGSLFIEPGTTIVIPQNY